jgi:alpha-L-arabinofuranosidase
MVSKSVLKRTCHRQSVLSSHPVGSVTTMKRCILFALGLLVIATPYSRAGQGGVLRNPGFESRVPLEDWQVVTYGSSAAAELDAHEVHEGAQSLRISAALPSDTALGQDLSLCPGAWYRFSGWVKTRGLDPLDAPVCGTFQVQRSAGRSVIAGGPSHSGDTPWSRVELVFRAPPDGGVRVAPFLVGYGKGRGTAWFDGMALEPVNPAGAPVIVTADLLRATRINPFQYGQFIEYLCMLVPAMWAEQLDDGGFEGLSPYKVAYIKETDFREHDWYPAGATNRAVFERDRTTKINGDQSLKIAVQDGAPCTVAISQNGVNANRRVGSKFTGFFKQSGIKSPVTISLNRDRAVYASFEVVPGEAWGQHAGRLLPAINDVDATLSISFRGPGTLWIDSVSLVSEDGVSGWRRDVVQAVREMKPGIIRFGGSTLDDPNLGEFEWRDTIGDPARRRPFRAWGGLQPPGAGLEEIVQFCRLVNAEPLICVRFSRREPQDAADQVQYLNGGVDTPMGALRAKNGHAEPYNVRYWQVGNERKGADYEERLAAFCQAMKKADPSIEIMSSYPTPGVLDRAGALLDFVAPHHYECENLAGEEDDLNAVRKMIAEHAKGRPIKAAVTEWNTTGGDWGTGRAKLWTLANALACSRYHNLMHRHCDLVQIACRSNLVNSFCSGCIQTDDYRLYKTPVYYAQQLYATLAGDRPLKIVSPLPATVGLDLSATLAPAGDAVILFAVNDSLQAISRPLDLSAFAAGDKNPPRSFQVWTLADTKAAGEPDVTNSFADIERIIPSRTAITPGSLRFDYSFPALSLTVLRYGPHID